MAEESPVSAMLEKSESKDIVARLYGKEYSPEMLLILNLQYYLSGAEEAAERLFTFATTGAACRCASEEAEDLNKCLEFAFLSSRHLLAYPNFTDPVTAPLLLLIAHLKSLFHLSTVNPSPNLTEQPSIDTLRGMETRRKSAWDVVQEASDTDRPNVIEYLLECDAAISKFQCRCAQPLNILHIKARLETVRKILSVWLTVFNSSFMDDLLLDAAARQDVHAIEKQIGTVKLESPGPCSSLHVAAYVGLVRTAEVLINGGHLINGYKGWFSPLHVAVLINDDTMAKFLLHRGASATETDEMGDSPLHWAVANGNMEMVVALVRYGADPSVVNRAGYSPVHIAVSKGDLKTILGFISAREDFLQHPFTL